MPPTQRLLALTTRTTIPKNLCLLTFLPLRSRFSTTTQLLKWEGSKPENHSTQGESDAHNPQQDGTAEGKKARAQGDSNGGVKGRATSESGGGSVERAEGESKSDGVKRNAGIGMQDERGGKE